MKFTIPKGSLHGRIKGNAVTYVGNLSDDRNWTVTIAEAKDERSHAQNATLWGVYYPPLMDFMGLSGERDREDLHQYFCGEYFGWIVTEIMGKKKQRPSRTTTTNEDGKRDVIEPRRFEDFCEFIKRTAAEHGCFIPDPEPQHMEIGR